MREPKGMQARGGISCARGTAVQSGILCATSAEQSLRHKHHGVAEKTGNRERERERGREREREREQEKGYEDQGCP